MAKVPDQQTLIKRDNDRFHSFKQYHPTLQPSLHDSSKFRCSAIMDCLANEMNTTTGQHFKVTKQAETEHYKWIGSTKIAFLM